MNLFQHLFNSGEKYIFIDNQQPKQIDFREPREIRICLYKLDVLKHHTCLGECIMFHSFHNCCQSFLFSHRHGLGLKRQMKKNAKMQDICNKETKTTAASLP